MMYHYPDLGSACHWLSNRDICFNQSEASPRNISSIPPGLREVSRRGTSATQRQKFHTDDVNQCLHDKSGSHGVPNANLFNFTFLLVDFGTKVLCSAMSEEKLLPFAG